MKKLVGITLALVIILSVFTVVRADSEKIDLSGMTYDELVALKDRINLAIWQSDEWQEVEVPQGVWKVGEDIPAGKWTIKALPGKYTYIMMGTELTNGGTTVDIRSDQWIISPEYQEYKEKEDVPEWTIDLEEGVYIKVEYSSAVFTPYAGKPSLGFMK